MSNEINTTITRKYLDYDGLQKLWMKINETYLKSNSLESTLDNLENPYTRKSYVDTQDEALDTRISQLEAVTGQNIDKDTIINVDGKMQTNLILDLDPDKKTLRLVTTDTEAEKPTAKTIISEIDYSPFIRDGLLNNISVVVVPSEDNPAVEGRPAGTYLKFEFNTDAGKEAIYLSTDELGIQFYTGSEYITIDSNNVVSINTVKLDTYLEDYINRSVKITDIISQLQSVQTSVQAIDNRVIEIEKLINGYIGENGEEIEGLTTQFTKLSETVHTFENRIVFLEENAAIEPISLDDINNLGNEN